MKTLTIFSFAFICSLQVFGLGKFRFQKEVHDFGLVSEGELAIYDFKFTNVGDEPIVMSNVKASCGCTTPSWPREPILPGKEGMIKVQYNSKGRVGIFNKSITITSNAEPATKVLRIKGIVEKPETIAAHSEEELKNRPILSLFKSEHTFGEVQLRSSYTHKFGYTNFGKGQLKILKVTSGCNCVTFSVDKAAINRGEKATLTLVYKPNTEGDVTEKVYVHTNDVKTPKTPIYLNAKVAKNLSNQSIMNQGKKTGF